MNMEKNKNTILTIFTPTYNRAFCLHLCYESLKHQTCQDFKWLIVDDGSTDNTRDLVGTWIDEGIISIKYIYQQNQGMHGAHNTAYDNCDTLLNVCIDSDDYMTDNAVEKIASFWKEYGEEKYSGIIAINITKEGKIVGTGFPLNKKDTTLKGYYLNGGSGDKKLIYRTDIMKKYPSYPVLKEEKYFGLDYKYILADQEYKLLILNEAVCVVEYMQDGSSMNIINQFKRNPKGFATYRRLIMNYSPTYKRKFIENIHYVSSSIMSKNLKFFKESPCKLTTFLAIPFGAALYLYIMNTSMKTVFKGNE